MINAYKCKYGLYHDKVVVDGEPSSNNGWIYTAYASKLGLLVDKHILNTIHSFCYKNDGDFYQRRLPIEKRASGNIIPPISRDELIGMKSLGFQVELNNDYSWHRVNTSNIPYYKKILATIRLYGKHRNYAWENRVVETYDIVFRLAAHDRYYFGQKNLYTFLMFQLYCVTTLLKTNKKRGSVSAKNVLWLQLKDMKSKFWIKFMKQKKNFLDYFGSKHIFNK